MHKNVLFVTILFFCLISSAHANNTTYITLSNQIARKNHLEVVANNVANSNTIGFEADSVLFKNTDTIQNAQRANSFVYTSGMYKREGVGDLRVTNRALDIAIGGPGYFKIITPRGFRYTLNGSIMINSEYVLVNTEGNPFASRDNQPIILPIDYQDVRVAQDGTVYVNELNTTNEVIVDILGVFDFEDKNLLTKEGNSLYSTRANDILVDELTIISGALRLSNFNSALGMTEMIESQRSVGMTDNLLSDLAALERSLLTKIAK